MFHSHAQLREYMTVLTENGLLAYDDKKQIFKTTEKGLQFLTIQRIRATVLALKVKTWHLHV
jgi:predicted transcriptional regulator